MTNLTNAECARLYKERHPGLHAERMRQYRMDHPETSKEANARFKKRHPERWAEIHNNGMKKYALTPKGKAHTALNNSRRREGIHTDRVLYAKRVEYLHTHRESCAICGALYQPTHQVDHILALILGGIDSWDNYQPVCLRCHYRKSAEDMQKYYASKEAMNARS